MRNKRHRWKKRIDVLVEAGSWIAILLVRIGIEGIQDYWKGIWGHRLNSLPEEGRRLLRLLRLGGAASRRVLFWVSFS